MTVSTLMTPAAVGAAPGTCRIVEGGRSAARRRHIDALLATATRRGYEAHHLSCRLDSGGVWAGVADLLRALLPRIEAERPDLIAKHSYELALALPELRRRFPLTDASLTDSSPLLHGVIDLLAEWIPQHGARLFVVCEDFDGAGALMRRFFHEFLRRRAARLPLDLVLVVENGLGEQIAAELEGRGGAISRLRCTTEEDAPDPVEIARLADVLEARLQESLGQSENDLPQLIRCSRTSSASTTRWRYCIAASCRRGTW